MNTTDNNKLIAEFMKVQVRTYTDGRTSYNPDKSWDLLMPVIDKIETVKNQRVCVNIGTSGIAIFLHNEEAYKNKDYHKYDFYTSKYGMDKLSTTYGAVVEFIQWYNENKEG